MKKLIYLASPYSSEFADVREKRVQQVQDAAARLIEQGNLIFSPIIHSHPIADFVSFSPVNTAEAVSGWMEYDFAMIDKCDEVWVLMLDGFEASIGCTNEIVHALSNGKTVKHISYPSLAIRTEVIPDECGFAEVKFFAPLTHTSYVPTEPKIIGLTGVAQSGKDTIGKYLVEEHDFVRVGLADAVRDAALALDPVVGLVVEQMQKDLAPSEIRMLEGTLGEQHKIYFCRLRKLVEVVGWEIAKQFASVRTTLQKIGTEAGRDIHGYECWVEIANQKIQAAVSEGKSVVITDVRFDNEAQMVLDAGGEVWRVERAAVGAINGHASEKPIKEGLTSAIVENSGTVADLHGYVKEGLEQYGK